MTAPTPQPDVLAVLDQLDALHAAARAERRHWRPWAIESDCIEGPDELGTMASDADAALIVAAVNRLPELTAALRAVHALAEEWRYKGEYGWGPWQAGDGPDIEGQILDAAADRLSAALAALTPNTSGETP